MTRNTDSFEATFDRMKQLRMKLPSNSLKFKIDNGKKILEQGMAHFLSYQGNPLEWIPEYTKVAEWLTDNQGKGLYMYGDPGRGKSLLGRYVLPAIMLMTQGKVVSAYDIQEMNRDIDLVLSKRLISLDDIGTEHEYVNYGQRRLAFAEIMDRVEKEGKLIIISTNLSVDKIRERYGERTIDRIRSTTRQVLFEGKSMRK